VNGIRQTSWPGEEGLKSPCSAVERADRLPAFRDRLFTSRKFLRWAAGCPLTRPFVRRHQRALFDLCAGFVYSQILLACVRLRLFHILRDGPQSSGELSRQLSLSPEAASRLLRAAVSLRLVSRRGSDSFGLGVLGAVIAGNAAIAQLIEHHALLYADLADPVTLLRGKRDTNLAGFWPYAGADRAAALGTDRVSEYTRLMAASQDLIAVEIMGAYCFGRHRCLLDVGGGDGSFLAAIGARYPALHLALFDLPAVAAEASARLAAAGLASRTSVSGGDFRFDPLPFGADIISLVRVVHDHDDDAALELFRAARRTLPEGGALLVAEPMSGTPGAEPVGDAYFGFYLLAMGSGRPRTAQKLAALLREAGFIEIRRLRTNSPLLTGAIVAKF
jgi:demethylspheroidene O-methyltransferase